MKIFHGFPAAVALLLSCTVVLAGPIGPVEVGMPGANEYRIDTGGGYFRQGRRVRTSDGKFDLTRNEVFGTLRYTGYDWSVGGRVGGSSFDEKVVGTVPGAMDRSEGFSPFLGFVAKALMVSDTSGDFGIGATVQATRYFFDAYQGYYNMGVAVTAQQRFGNVATIYGGPSFSFGGGRRKGSAIDNNGESVYAYAKETPLVGLCAGFSFALPKSMVFDVEGQFMGLGGGSGISAGLSSWGVGGTMRIPLWY